MLRDIWDSLHYFIIFIYPTFSRGTLTMFCGILFEKRRIAVNGPNDRFSFPGQDRHFYLRRGSGTNQALINWASAFLSLGESGQDVKLTNSVHAVLRLTVLCSYLHPSTKFYGRKHCTIYQNKPFVYQRQILLHTCFDPTGSIINVDKQKLP